MGTEVGRALLAVALFMTLGAAYVLALSELDDWLWRLRGKQRD